MNLKSRIEQLRIEEMSTVGFWVMGPVAIIVTLQAAFFDVGMYPDYWHISWLWLRLGIVPISLCAVTILKTKMRYRYSELAPLLVALYLAVVAVIIHRDLGFKDSVIGNLYMEILLGGAIIPMLPLTYLAACILLIGTYIISVYVGREITVSDLLKNYLLIHQNYIILAGMIYVVSNKMQRKFFLSKIKLENELGSRQREIDSLVAVQLGVKEAQVKYNLSRQVAHDIRSPLTALNSIIIQKDLNSDNVRELLIGTIDRINEIANDLLRTPAQDDGSSKLQTSSLKEVSEKFISHKRLELGLQNSELMLAMGENLDVQIPIIKFERLLSNLINNSFQASHKGQVEILIAIDRKEEDIYICVSDTGIGISNELLSKVGESGFTTKNDQGHGIGLSFCKDLVSQWNGTFDIISTESVGTKISIKCPLRSIR